MARGRFLLLALVYLGAMVIALVLVNENAESGRLAAVVWGVASILCGWFARSPFFALLALLAIPLSIPFGHSEEWVGSDAPLVLYFGFLYGFLSAFAIVLVSLLRRLIEHLPGRSDRHPQSR